MLSQFLDALERMPDLTHLQAEGILPTSSHMHGVLFPTERRVELPHLKLIELGGDTLDVALALSCLIIPSGAHLAFECTSLNDLSDVASLFRLVSDQLGTAAPILMESLITRALPRAFDIVARMKFPTGSSSQIDVIFKPSPWHVEISQQFLITMLHSQVSEFVIIGMPLDPRQWHCLFTYENMASMESMVITVPPDSLLGFFGLLSPRPVSKLQKLRYLNFDRTDFGGMQWWLDYLKSALKERKEYGMALEVIAFYRCSSLNDEWVAQLQDIVPTVVVSDESPFGEGSTHGDSDRSSSDESDEYSDDELTESSGS
ncbi:hypothetical protein EWM64_g265 [Hericium alpestre]|uniref:F-box domain-containing protein n=1 Tax=Hericium alpestre TaxID=135208 RepID=A0A4Z0ACC8_9AGAM|nr:hypothetical protein EWM64_g265 [Hericium alpestre]